MENQIQIQVPVTISYPALKEELKQKVIGQYIPDPDKGGSEDAYGQIMDVAITGSRDGAYDVVLALKVRILRTLLKRDNVDLLVFASLGYDNVKQLVYIRKYRVDVKTSSGFYNTALEVLANKVAYEKVMKKARVNLGIKIGEEVAKINEQLAKGLEMKGLRINGVVDQVQILDLDAGPDLIALNFLVTGQASVQILDLNSLVQAAINQT